MQLVIDIPREEYIKITLFKILHNSDTLIDAFRQAEILPDEHGELKDVSKLKEKAINVGGFLKIKHMAVLVEDIDQAEVLVKEKRRNDNADHN